MAEEYELVGIGPHKLGSMDGWMVTYEKAPAAEEGGIPDFHHHMFPSTIFSNYAEQFGLDLNDPDDFDEILDILLHDPFAGDEDPQDYVEPLIAKKSERGNKTGRRMRRRANRGKDRVQITGLGAHGIRDRLYDNRHQGLDDLRARIEKLEAKRGIPRTPDRSVEDNPEA